jgi:hypothetical protein
MKHPPIRRVMIAIALLYPFWIAMMAVHELGHVLGALATGGNVVQVTLPLFGFSRTDVDPNPYRRVEVWSGPVLGASLPLIVWALLRQTRFGPILQAFASWCLVANGAYVGVGWIERSGDAGELVRLGTPRWLMIAFGVVCASAGLYLWHLMGESPTRPTCGTG